MLCTSLFLGISVQADVLVGYDFDVNSSDLSQATVLAATVSASELTSPMDVGFTTTIGDTTGVDAYGEAFGSTDTLGGIGIGVNDATTSSFEAAVAGDDYLSFTLTPDSGVGLHLTGISFKASKKATTSVDEYAITDASGNLIGSSATITTVVGLTGAYDGVIVDLSDTEFESITEATEFRIYAWGRGTNKTANTLAVVDKVTVHGTAEVLGEDFYVSMSGDDSNAGTFEAPFATIQHALNQAGPGSTVFIREGSYHEAVDLAGIAGAAGFPITLTNYGDEAVVLDGRVKIETAWTLEERGSVVLPEGNDTPSENIPGIGNVYVTTLDASVGDITQLFVDNDVMTLARFPNALAYSDEVWSNETYLFKTAPSHGVAIDVDGSVAASGVSFTGCVGIFGSPRIVTEHATGDSEFTHNAPIRLESGTTSYFFEGGLNNGERVMLDIAQEWAYDESTQTLAFWPKDNENPNSLNVYGKNLIYAFTGDATTKYIVIDDLDFFATTVDFNFSDHITIQNCDFEYYSFSERALGSENHSKTTDFTGGSSDFCEDITVYNCAFRFASGSGLIANYIDGLTIENCLFNQITYVQLGDWDEYGNRRALHVVDTNNAMDIVYRRNTVSVSSALQSVRLRRYLDAEDVHPFVAEYNLHTECCRLGGDASSMYSPLEHVWESVSRYNWFMENLRRDFRWDGLNADEVGTAHGNFYRNVAYSIKYSSYRDSAYRLKGDFHEVYQSTAVGEDGNFDVAQDKGGNANTISCNNAADVLSTIVEQSVEPDYFEADGEWALGSSDRAENDWDLTGIDSNNYSPVFTAYTRSMHELLRDPDNWDFRPRADAVELIDQGVPVTCTINGVEVDVTEGYLGSAPDLGAYEYGDSTYWIPGRQEAQASMPIPRNGRGSVPLDTDLMYLIGLEGVGTHIYFGKSPNALSYLTSKTDPENIVTLSDYTILEEDMTYYWRVDTVLTDGSVVTGDVWSFNTPFTPLANKEILSWSNNSIQNGYWSQNTDGDLVYTNSGSQFYKRAIAYSTDVYQSDTGFKLTAYYTTASIGDVLAHNFSFGLISTDTDLSTDSGYNPFKIDTSVYSLGVNLTANGNNSAQGLTFTDGSTRTTLDRSGDNIQFPVDESTEVVIEILPNGRWSYAINGVTEASGVIEGGFDLTKSYRVAVYAQDDSGGEKSIQHLSLESIPSGLLTDWSMDESSGEVVVDDSGYGFDAMTLTGSRVSGLEGNAIELNGSNASVALPAKPLSYINDEVTVALWVYGDTTQARADTLFDATDVSGNRVINILLPWSNGIVYWHAGNTGSTYDRILKAASASEYKDQWNHWVFTKNATTGEMAIYLNGELWQSGTGRTRSMEGITTGILGNDLNNNAYAGIIDEVQIYNVALSASEVFDLAYSYTTNNGTPKAWLVSNGIAPTNAGAVADSDGDGLVNWREYNNGTDPLLNNAPEFSVNTYTGSDATVGVSYSATLAALATDSEGQALTYSMQDGPSWLSISSAGVLSGTPSAGDLGSNSWTVQVSDGDGSDTVILNITVVMNEGLVAQWAMNEASGMVVSDATGNEFTGSSVDCTVMTGVGGNALAFNGSTSCVTLPSSAFASLEDEVSIAMWAFGDTSLPQSNSVFYATDSAGNRILNVHLPWGNSNVYWDAGDGSGYDRINKKASSAEYQNAWNHWVFTKNASTGLMNIYLNGVLWHSGTGNTSSIGVVDYATFGAQISGYSYSGVLDDVLLYNVELSSDEVMQLYLSY
jgi:hypothetical protein